MASRNIDPRRPTAERAARFPILAALLLSALFSASPALGEKTVTTLLAATATGASSSVGTVGAGSDDVLVFQATYPSGATVTLDATLDGTTWMTTQTWDGSGKIFSAPIVGGLVYRANVSAYSGASTFTGSGLDDATFGGTYSGGTVGDTFDVVIDANGTPDTFKWRRGAAAYTTGVAITGSAQTLSNGVTVTFLATTGHTVNDKWTRTFAGVYVYVTASGSAQVKAY